ncbi:MAG: hypothetical protein QOK05_943 [Chloroflexota bacterium]|jgi:rhodanese-related sulfurtransferase|nr:hypothetical protein [Chloroflexota bacterium]
MTVDEMLEDARHRLVRVGAVAAAAELGQGALLVDIRPEAQRHSEGQIPGALVIERNVLEWRLDPTSEWRIPELRGPDTRVIVVCSEGYTSSLAAAALQDLGLHRATDLEGGFWAWFDAGLPTETAGRDRLENQATAHGG